MAGDASVNHIHVAQNAADSSSPLSCSPACPQPPPQQEGADYEDDTGDSQNGAGHVAPAKSSQNGAKTSQQSAPKVNNGNNKKQQANNKKASQAAVNEIPRAPQTKQQSATKSAGPKAGQGGKQVARPAGGSSGNAAKKAEPKANACPGSNTTQNHQVNCCQTKWSGPILLSFLWNCQYEIELSR